MRNLSYNQASSLYGRTYKRLHKLFPDKHLSNNKYPLYQDRYTGYGFYHRWYFVKNEKIICSLTFSGWDILVEKQRIGSFEAPLAIARKYTVEIQRI